MTTDKTERKERPIARGVLDYFPDAIAEVAHVSFMGSKQHHPDQEMHWDKSKSPDHADCLTRHLMERGAVDDDGLRHSAKVAWRALAMLQIEIEEDAAIESIYDDYEYAEMGDAARSPRTGIYIAGPMRGYPESNFPAFHKAAALGRSMGFVIVNPAEEDIKQGIDGKQVLYSKEECREFARRDIALILDCAAIAVLPGWDMSKGATAEVALARWLGMSILDARTFEALEA